MAQRQQECALRDVRSADNQRSIFVSQDASDDNQLSLIAEIPDEAGNLQVKARKRGGKRHRSHWMKRPMAVSEVILELQDSLLRENALRCLSAHLIERREQDFEFYRNAGFFIYNSCGTVAILLQEILSVYPKLDTQELNIRGSKRLANVLTLLQSVASNEETRGLLVKEHTEEVYENVRAISLSVIGIVCQVESLVYRIYIANSVDLFHELKILCFFNVHKAREAEVIYWALQSDIVQVCLHAMQIGSELSKVIAMYILEALLQNDHSLAAICDPACGLLTNIVEMCSNMVKVLAAVQDFSPRLLFHIIRCFILLSQHPVALDLLRERLPIQLQNSTFLDLAKEFPMLGQLLHQLLLNTGKVNHLHPFQDTRRNSPDEDQQKEKSPRGYNNLLEASPENSTPLRPIDLNKQDWASIARHPGFQTSHQVLAYLSYAEVAHA
ncbi:hypothetical protein O6H91_02G104900 [Diphasiastrum complanatum]|uniref:Uncharacterized protein n=1 Tax=Diphasiastrum complanatum TaxID=34168 RepID=A0ACC2EIR1_DIPCM|nr:hypothetical protein O6H91_02G104900 [Diphasiastrum complanatum]